MEASLVTGSSQVFRVVLGQGEVAAEVGEGRVARVGLALAGDQLGRVHLGVVLRLVSEGACLVEGDPAAPGVRGYPVDDAVSGLLGDEAGLEQAGRVVRREPGG